MKNAIIKDVSKYNIITDWNLFSSVVDMILIKSSQNQYQDPTFAEKIIKAREYKMRIGIWHFLQPDVNGTVQAKFFIDLYRKLLFKPPTYLDVEEIHYWTTDENGNRKEILVLPPSKEAHTLWIMQWLIYVEAETGLTPGIYTRASWWNQWVIRSNTSFKYNGVTYKTPDWSRYDLWVANYDAATPYLPKDWKKWLIWQYGASKVPGVISGDVDSDIYNGTVEDLDFHYGFITDPTQPPSEPPSPSEPPKPIVYTQFKSLTTGLRIRTSPMGKIKSSLSFGEILELDSKAEELEIDQDGYVWVPCRVWVAKERINGTKYGTLQ